jgi:hypothetical protein
MKRFLAGLGMGLLLAAAASAGVYALVATTAPSMAASFSSDEVASHALITEFSTASQREAAVREAARAKCASLTGDSRQKSQRLRRACVRAAFPVA